MMYTVEGFRPHPLPSRDGLLRGVNNAGKPCKRERYFILYNVLYIIVPYTTNALLYPVIDLGFVQQ